MDAVGGDWITSGLNYELFPLDRLFRKKKAEVRASQPASQPSSALQWAATAASTVSATASRVRQTAALLVVQLFIRTFFFSAIFFCAWVCCFDKAAAAAAALTSLMASHTHTQRSRSLLLLLPFQWYFYRRITEVLLLFRPHSATNFLVHREMVTSEHSEGPCTRSILAKRPTFVILQTQQRDSRPNTYQIYIFGAFIMAHYASRSNSLVLILNYIVGTPFLVVVHGGGIRDFIYTYIGRDCNTLTHWYENLESYSSEISLLSLCYSRVQHISCAFTFFLGCAAWALVSRLLPSEFLFRNILQQPAHFSFLFYFFFIFNSFDITCCCCAAVLVRQ